MGRRSATGLTTFLLLTGVAWLAWQALEGSDPTLTRAEFRWWLLVSGAGAVVVVLTGAVLWRDDDARTGLAVGTVAAALAVLVGLGVDVLTSAS